MLLRKKEKKKKKDAVIDFAKKVDSYLFKNQLYLNHKCKDPFLKVLMSYINMIDWELFTCCTCKSFSKYSPNDFGYIFMVK